MKTNLILTAVATVAFASTAMAAPKYHRMHEMKHHNMQASGGGSAAVKELNEKSLQQALAGPSGSSMTPRSGAMSDSGAAAPMGTTPDAAPMGSPANNSMAPSGQPNAMTPPATPTPPN